MDLRAAITQQNLILSIMFFEQFLDEAINRQVSIYEHRDFLIKQEILRVQIMEHAPKLLLPGVERKLMTDLLDTAAKYANLYSTCLDKGIIPGFE